GDAPFVRRTTARLYFGWVLSRFGPMLPPQPIAFSVWQLPQDWALTKAMPGPVAVAAPSMFGALEPFQVRLSNSTAMAPAKPIAIGRREMRRSRVRSMNGIPTRIAIQIVGMMI